MADTHRPFHPAPALDGGLSLSQADFDALVHELDGLRRTHRADLERRLRDAREFGSPADDDERLSVFEEVAADQSRIATLEGILRSACVVDDTAAFDGRAGHRCLVRVRDERGRISHYRLVGRRSASAVDGDVSIASPVGQAILGARAGDVVRVTPPSGRERTLHVIEVIPRESGTSVNLRVDAVAAA
jgi:transcription elongation factor GreA